MALVTFGGGITAARGKVAGNVYSRSRSGGIWKGKTSGVNPTSPAQGLVRANLAANSNDWSNNTSVAHQATWNALALVTPVTNVFGQTLYLTGQQLFNQVNCNLMNALNAPINIAPADLNVNPYTSATMVVNHAIGTAMVLTLGLPAVIGTPFTYIFAAPPMSKGTSFVSSRLRLLKIFTGVASPLDITNEYRARFGNNSIIAGRKYFALCSIINLDNGAVASGIMASAIST